MLAGLDAATVQGVWRTDADLAAAVDALTTEAPPPISEPEPIILVCTHGVHDTCCALRGRPVAAVLSSHWPELVWECSHVGGDRFAPNVLVLPDGFYYGNLEPDEAVTTVRQHLAGTVAPGYLRGQVRYPPPVQAAVVAAYERCPPLGPGQITVRSVEQIGPHDGHGSETIVDLEVASLRAAIRVEMLSVRRPEAKLTCRAPRATPATEYRLQRFEQTTLGG
jgi:(2Fe-2S) ferredoxin